MNFKKGSNIFLGIFVILFFVSGCEKDVIKHDIDSEILTWMEVYDLPSVTACVIKNDAIVWKNSYGYRDIESQSNASRHYLTACERTLTTAG